MGLFGGVDEEMQSGTNEDDLLSVMTPLSPAASAVDGHHKKGKRGPKRSPKKTKYNVSGFILYGAEHRKNIKHTQPGLSFQVRPSTNFITLSPACINCVGGISMNFIVEGNSHRFCQKSDTFLK